MNHKFKIILIVTIMHCAQFMQAAQSDWYTSFMPTLSANSLRWPASWKLSKRSLIHPINNYEVLPVDAQAPQNEASVLASVTHEINLQDDNNVSANLARQEDMSMHDISYSDLDNNAVRQRIRRTVALALVSYPDTPGQVQDRLKNTTPPTTISHELEFVFADRSTWTAACKRLKKNIDMFDIYGTPTIKKRSAFNNHPAIYSHKELAWQEFDKALTAVIELMRRGKLNDKFFWVGNKPDRSFYNLAQQIFMPYVQRLDLQEGQKVIFHGDIHGDIHSLINELDALAVAGYFVGDTFELVDKNNYMIFLGDYVDRGHYGSEVMYTLFRLKLANPENVIMVRGNHEEESISNVYGFAHELIDTFGPSQNGYNKIYRLYNFLPVALYVGSGNDYVQCCHGGLEYGYKPEELLRNNKIFQSLENKLYRADFIDYLKRKDKFEYVNHLGRITELFKNITISSPANEYGKLGFMWFDFVKNGSSQWTIGRGLAADKDLTQTVLRYQNYGSFKKVRGIVRAHQHAVTREVQDPLNLMQELIDSRGLYNQWQPIETRAVRRLSDGIVWTLNVAPDGMYGSGCNFKFGTYAILTIGSQYEDWMFEIFNTQLY